MTANIIEMGANTINFTPSENSYKYLNEDSIQKSNMLLNKKSASCINEHNHLYQLRQIRSKFYCLLIYIMCRSFGSTASNLMFHPYTIWTLYEYDSPQKFESQSQKLSLIFQAIVYAVIENGINVRINIDVFKCVHASLKNNKVKLDIVDILKLEEENGLIAIINSVEFSLKLQALADGMVGSIKNSNDVAKQLLLESYRH